MLINLVRLILFIFLILNQRVTLGIEKVIINQNDHIEESKIEHHFSGSNRHQQRNERQQDENGSRKVLLLESMEDLEQIAYMSMRNFNITDDSLLQSNWFGGLSDSLGGRGKYQKVSSGTSAVKNRLALMLESFIWRLRNGHLRRLKVEDLYAMLISFGGGSDSIPYTEQPQFATPSTLNYSNSTATIDEAYERCRYLVSIYKLEQQQQQQQQRNLQEHLTTSEDFIADDDDNEELKKNNQQVKTSDSRLNQLCRLAVSCHSADELVSLIGTSVPQLRGAKRRQIRSGQLHTLEPEPADPGVYFAENGALNQGSNPKSRSLRDSLSSSLAKLCPLILFQLHDDEGVCSVRRDDRPPTVTVWAFATLFVTIVSFCSLIGLSITPLLGNSSGKYVSGKSETEKEHSDLHIDGQAEHYGHADEDEQWWVDGSASHAHQQHQACLTLFEGLAVGSLVGSALFSLIPQAFELQERESNQGFLLKALIIFFGIYLFFCSERVMRIILDSRQQRKKRKRLNHRSSNSVPLMAAATSTAVVASMQPPIELSSWADRGEQQATNKRAAQRRGRSDPRLRKLSSERVTAATVEINEQEQQAAGTPTTQSSTRSSQRLRQQARPHHVKGQELGETCTELSGRRNLAKATTGKVPFIATDCKYILTRPATATAAAAAACSLERQLMATRGWPDQHTKTLACDASLASGKAAGVSCSGSHRSSKSANRSDCFVCNQTTREQQQQQQHLLTAAARRQRHTRKTRQQLSANRRQQQLRRRLRRESSSAGASAGSSSSLSSSSSSSSSFWTLEMQDLSNRYRNNYCSDPHSIGSRSTPKKQQHNSLTSRVNSPSYSPSPRDDSEQPNKVLPSQRMQRAKVDISTVAWMIILGDGLHNFIDGISIGAAFAESILSGVSISVAVICEEFPHELGDFAVLVSSGMTVRQALGYNFLSACTCYLGMVVGIVLGDVNEGASYISALAAGVFLYIALVDMMGELSAALEETSRDSITRTLKLFLLQNVGIFIGISIIFVLSFIDF